MAMLNVAIASDPTDPTVHDANINGNSMEFDPKMEVLYGTLVPYVPYVPYKA